MPELTIEQPVYIDRSPLITLSTSKKAEKYNELLPQACRTFKILHITEQTIAVDENCIPQAVIFNGAMTIASTVKHSRRVTSSNTFLK